MRNKTKQNEKKLSESYNKTKGIMLSIIQKVKVGGNVKHDEKDFDTLPKVSNLRSVTILRDRLFSPCSDNVTFSCHKNEFKHYMLAYYQTYRMRREWLHLSRSVK